MTHPEYLARVLGMQGFELCALRARVDELEAENAALKQKLADYDAKPRMALVPDSEKVS